jgi:hypothetical protein
MSTRIVETEYQQEMAVKYVAGLKLPFTLSVTMGKHRSAAQNRLAFAWYKEAAEQLGDVTPSEVRAYCKLTIGVPIRREDDAFREAYDRLVKPLSYEEKLALMVEPFDLAVTRHMTTKQLTRYLDDMQRHYAEQGIILTTPEWADFMEKK